MDLLAAIYANPADDGPRAVYADALIERGDPRGEFIALQLANRDDARQRELLQRHEQAWTAPICSAATFRRGFVSRVAVDGDTLHVDDPAWATVEHIDGEFPDALLFHAPLRALRSFSRHAPPDWRALSLAGVTLPAFTELVVELDVRLDPEAARQVCPALRSCLVYAERIRPSLFDVIVRLGLDFPTVRLRRSDPEGWLADHAMVVDEIDRGIKYGRIDELELETPSGLTHYRWDQLGKAHWGYAIR